MGRITALRKDGGVRGITVGDILRRLVARRIAQQISKVVEESTALYQYALSTKVGCECVAHIVQTLTGSDESATVVSVDGIGAFDLISRNAMLEGLMGIDGGDAVFPFVRQFYGHPSAHIWEDDMGNVHEIAQGEGGEQGERDRFRPISTSASFFFEFGQFDFGEFRLRPILDVLKRGPEGWWPRRGPNLEKVGPRRVEAPNFGGPKGGARRVGG